MSNPPLKIAFLHTAAVHEQTFAALLNTADTQLQHATEPRWLAQAQAEGLSPELKSQVLAKLQELANAADAVVCTCSTLGPLVDELVDEIASARVFRIDAPMMQIAASIPGTALLVACLESTVEPSSQLLLDAYAAQSNEPNFEVLLCTQAWQHFEQQNQAAFAQSIADAVVAKVSEQPDNFGCIVLAQASMASAATQIGDQIPNHIQVLRSPPLATMHALMLAAEQSIEGSSP